MSRTCCPQYTIRLESLDFKPNKKHRQVMNRFNRYLQTGEKPGKASEAKGKGKAKESADWIDSLRAHHSGYAGAKEGKHRFEVSWGRHTPKGFRRTGANAIRRS